MDGAQMGLVIWILSMGGLYLVVASAINHSQLCIELKSLNEKIDTLNEKIQHLESWK